MSKQAERKRLKRTLLREMQITEFDYGTTEIAERASAADVDQISERESDSDNLTDVLHYPVLPNGFVQGNSPPRSPLSDPLQQIVLSQTSNQSDNITACCLTSYPQESSDLHSSDASAKDLSEDSSDGCDYDYCDQSDNYASEGDSQGGLNCHAQGSSCENASDLPLDLNGDLVNWSFKNKIKHAALDELLVLLRKHGHTSLPKLAVTLLQTHHRPSSNIIPLGAGEYWYHGLLNCLKAYFKPPMSSNNEIKIDFFVDGVSPYNTPSKNVHLWPIAGRIICDKIVTKPFIIALWCGSSHEPDPIDDFLEPFVNECIDLMGGFDLNGVTYKLKIQNGIGDAPARSLLKKTNPHQSIVCCERCEIRCYKTDNTMVFPICKCTARTDESFVNKSDSSYHKGISPLEKIMKMISQFPLEPLHLVDLGVTKRILKMLVKRKASRVYLKPTTLVNLDKKIALLSQFSPSEFGQWKPKGLKHYSSLKGKELKRFLKYDGILTMAVLEEMIPDQQKGLFECFLKFSLGIRILSDHELCIRFVDDANHLLQEFVKDSVEVFGPHFVVFNVHHLTHLPDDCKVHGPLDNFDAYLYESYLGQFSNYLNAPGRPLPQIIARTLEREKHGYTEFSSTCKDTLSQPFFLGPTDNLVGEAYGVFKGVKFTIRVSYPNDQCCISKNNDVIIVENIVKTDDCIYFVGRSFMVKEPFFFSPVDSTLFSIFKVRSLGPIGHWPLSEIDRKCFLMPLDLSDEEAVKYRFVNGCLVVPFTH